MGTEGLEPSRTITRQRILSPSCLPIPPRPPFLFYTDKHKLNFTEENNHRQYYSNSFTRRHPDLNWGSRICNPLPYHLAIPPLALIKNNIKFIFYFVNVLKIFSIKH